MCEHEPCPSHFDDDAAFVAGPGKHPIGQDVPDGCLLYTSDAADERSSVDLGGRRIIKKKKHTGLSAISDK